MPNARDAAAPPGVPASSVSATDAVAAAPRCPACGYDVRGLARSGRCPECGGPVEAAYRANNLPFADPIWLRTVYWGCVFAHAALVPIIIIPILLIMLRNQAPAGTVFAVALLAATVLFAIGIWLVTSPNPALAPFERPWCARRVARLTMCIALCGAMVLPLTLRAMWLPAAMVIVLGLSPIGVAGLAAVISLTRHVETLAGGAAADDLVRRARAYRLGFIITWALTMVLFAIPAVRVVSVAGVLLQAFFGLLAVTLPGYLIRHIQPAPRPPLPQSAGPPAARR